MTKSDDGDVDDYDDPNFLGILGVICIGWWSPRCQYLLTLQGCRADRLNINCTGELLTLRWVETSHLLQTWSLMATSPFIVHC